MAAEDSEDDAPKRKKRKQRGEASAARGKKKANNKKSKQGIFSKGGGSDSDTVSERGDDSDDDDDDEAPVKEDPPLPASPPLVFRLFFSHADTSWAVCVQEEVFYRVNEERFHLEWRAHVRRLPKRAIRVLAGRADGSWPIHTCAAPAVVCFRFVQPPSRGCARYHPRYHYHRLPVDGRDAVA